MKIIPQSVELFKHDIGEYKFIEKCARVCYKSEDKITEDSAAKMVGALKKNGHRAMFEHEFLYFKLEEGRWHEFWSMFGKYATYLHFASNKYITGSIRAWMELFITLDSIHAVDIDSTMMWLAHNKLPLLFDEPMHEEKVYGIELMTREQFVEDAMKTDPDILKYALPHTFKFITNRGVGNELTRHRANIVFAQESSRYVDYSADGSEHQITVIHPLIHETDLANYNSWHYACLMAETQYMNLRKGGIAAENARGVLPLDCKTEIVATATEEEWQHIINLRCHGTTGRPHPQMKELMDMTLPILTEESNGRIK